MNEITYDGKNAFVVTPKGIHLLNEYKKFHEFTESFGLGM
jgi:predicted transcriptional regulator